MYSESHKQASLSEYQNQNLGNEYYSSWVPPERSPSSNMSSPPHRQTTPLLTSGGGSSGGVVGIGFGSANTFKSAVNKLSGAFEVPHLRVSRSPTRENNNTNNNNVGGNGEEETRWWTKTFDPSSETVLMWNRIFLVACLVALFVDPIFFFLPQLVEAGEDDEDSLCVSMDMQLGAAVTVFRTVADAFYLLHVLLRFRTAFVAPSTRVFGRGELVRDRKQIATRYFKSAFFFDLIAALPLPQIVIWFIIPAIKHANSRSTYNALQLIVFTQYFPRLYQIYTLSSEIINAAGVVTKTAWAGAAYNLLLYILASHISGAAWYLLSIERYSSCWKSACRDELSPISCRLRYLDCSTKDDNDRILWANSTQVFSLCDPDNPDEAFDFGIFENIIDKGVGSEKFMIKYFYCLWWGLQQLSSFGQELETSTFIGENIFCIVIAVLGLIMFALLIGNMETYMQSITSRVESWRLRKRDTEEWMRHRQLPQDLRERVRRFGQYKWLATRGVDEDDILHSLPLDLRRDIQRHLCLAFVKRVPFFAQMDDQLLDAICVRLSSSLNTTGSVIVREGDPVTEMLFIVRGKLESSTTNGGRSGFFNSITLRPGDFCGEELLAWALLPNAVNLPSSTRTLKAIEEVEAFSLEADDLKFVATQFRRLHSKKLQHTFRYYSHQWRAWGACFIQAAWRRHKKRTVEQGMISRESSRSSLAGYEDIDDCGSQEEDPNNDSSNGVRNARRLGSLRNRDMEYPKMMKPQDPDFFVDA